MTITTSNKHPIKVKMLVGDGDGNVQYANSRPYKVKVVGGGGGGGTDDFNDLENRPKYNGTTMTGDTNIPEVPDINQVVGKAKTLTTSDYNANSNDWSDTDPTHFNCLATWKLDEGLYKLGSSVVVYYSTTSHTTPPEGHSFLVLRSMINAAPTTALIHQASDSVPPHIVLTNSNTGVAKYDSPILVSKDVFNDAFQNQIKIGSGATATWQSPVAIGVNSQAKADYAIGIGNGAKATAARGIAIGNSTNTSAQKGITIGDMGAAQSDSAIAIGANSLAAGIGQIALGANSAIRATTKGIMSIGTENVNYGYNNSNYRLLTGLYGGQSDHDAVILGQLNSRITQNAGAPTTSTVGVVGQILEDTTNGKLYICTDATNPYVWEELATKSAIIAQVLGEDETYTIATSDWVALSGKTPYTYKADITATHTIGVNTIVELLNNNPVVFANNGIVIGEISGQTVTIYSVGVPSANLDLIINYKER